MDYSRPVRRIDGIEAVSVSICHETGIATAFRTDGRHGVIARYAADAAIREGRLIEVAKKKSKRTRFSDGPMGTWLVPGWTEYVWK